MIETFCNNQANPSGVCPSCIYCTTCKVSLCLAVNQTAGMLGTWKTELTYASISLCLDIIKIHILCAVLALVIVVHNDHNLF